MSSLFIINVQISNRVSNALQLTRKKIGIAFVKGISMASLGLFVLRVSLEYVEILLLPVGFTVAAILDHYFVLRCLAPCFID